LALGTRLVFHLSLIPSGPMAALRAEGGSQ